jgi:hypothetical protein
VVVVRAAVCGGEKQLSACKICRFFVSTEDRLLVRVASLCVLACFCGGAADGSDGAVKGSACSNLRRCGGFGDNLSSNTGFFCCWQCVRGGLRAVFPPLVPGLSPLQSRARRLSFAGHPGLREGGSATVGGGGGGILRKIVSFSIPRRTSYNTLAQPPLSTHLW